MNQKNDNPVIKHTNSKLRVKIWNTGLRLGVLRARPKPIGNFATFAWQKPTKLLSSRILVPASEAHTG